MEKLDAIIQQYIDRKISLLQVLHNIQNEYNHLPRKVLEYLSKALHLPMSKIYSVATFYHSYSLKQAGKHRCTVCKGTVCHINGAQEIYNYLEHKLSLFTDDNTSAKHFTLDTVNCLGLCSSGPNIIIDGECYNQMDVGRIDEIIRKYT